MGIVYTRKPGRADGPNQQRELELLAAAEKAGWPPVYIQPEQRPVSQWSEGSNLNVRFAGEDGWRTFVQLAGAAQLLAAQRLLLCILVGMADELVGEPDGPLIGPANDWGAGFERLAHHEPVTQSPYLVKTVGVAYGWDKASVALRELVLERWPNAPTHELRFEPDDNEGVLVSTATGRGLLHFRASQIEQLQLRIDAVPSEEHVAAVDAGAQPPAQAEQPRTDGADYLAAVRHSLSHKPRSPRSQEPPQQYPHGHQDARGNPYEHRHTDSARPHGHLADAAADVKEVEEDRLRREYRLNRELDDLQDRLERPFSRAEEDAAYEVPVVNKRTGKPVEPAAHDPVLDAGHAE